MYFFFLELLNGNFMESQICLRDLAFLPKSSWNNPLVRNIWATWFVQMSSLSGTISVWQNGAQNAKKKQTYKQWLPPACLQGVGCACFYCAAGWCWIVWDVGRCVHWMEGHPLWGRTEKEGSRTGQLCRASATRAEITVEEETLFPLDQGVSSLT